MTTPTPPSIETLNPGDVVELADVTELPQFEDLVAITIDRQVIEVYPAISSRLNLAAWAGRSAIGELIRPQKPRPFNGTIAGVKLEVMDDAVARLQDANERGWTFMQGKGSGQPTKFSQTDRNKLLFDLWKGFTLTAEAKSSGRGTIGEIRTELWYMPLPTDLNHGRAHQNVGRNGGSTVRRFVARPKLDTDKFTEFHERSQRIGLEVLRANLKNPISVPMGE